MATLCYLLRRFVAIVLGLALTGYSAWASWSHHHDLIGPLAAIAAAALLALCEHAWRDRLRILAVLLGVFGLASAVISGAAVMERVAATQAARTHAAASANLPRSLAQTAVTEAQGRLAAAEAAVLAETMRKDKPGCGLACKGLKKEVEAARVALASARTQQASLGAEVALNPAVSILGPHAETFQLVTLLGLPLWLELAAPIVLAYGLRAGADQGTGEAAQAQATRQDAAGTSKACRSGGQSNGQAPPRAQAGGRQRPLTIQPRPARAAAGFLVNAAPW